MSAVTARRWLIPTLILIAAAVVYASFSARKLIALSSAIAQSIGFERDDYKVYPTITAPQNFFGRVYARTRISPVKLQSAASTDEASSLVGFPVRAPEAPGMGALDQYIISGAHGLQVYADLDEARRILADSSLETAELPSSLEDIQVKVDLPTSVVINQSQGERWYTLIQSSPVAIQDVNETNSVELASLLMLNLRSLGLSQQDAQRFASEFGWEDFFAVSPTELALAELVSVGGSPALLLSQHLVDPALRAVVWQADGTLYGLYGSLPPEELLQMAESLGGG